MANIFGSSSAATAVKAFEESNPADFDDWRIGDHVGAHILITVKAIESVETSFGVKDAVRHDVVHYDENGKAGLSAEDILTFSAAVVRDLRQYEGQSVFAKVGTYEAKKYKKIAPCLVAPDAAYLDAYSKAN